MFKLESLISGVGVAKKHLFLEKGVALVSQKTGVGQIGVTNKTVTAERVWS